MVVVTVGKNIMHQHNAERFLTRKRIIRESGRCNCFTCLRRGHLSRDCRTASKCGHCRGRHHSSICTRMHKTRPQNGEEEHLQSSLSEKNSLLAHSESRLNPECAGAFSAT